MTNVALAATEIKKFRLKIVKNEMNEFDKRNKCIHLQNNMRVSK